MFQFQRVHRLFQYAVLTTLPFLFLGQTSQPATVDNPIYTAWASRPPGTTATYKITSESPGRHQTFTLESKARLIKVNPQDLVVEVTTTIPGLPARTVTLTHPAKVDKDRQFIAYLPAEARATVAIKQVSDGRDTLTVEGKPLECPTLEVTFDRVDPDHKLPPFSYTCKYWLAPTLPGGYAQSESTIETQGSVLGHTITTYTGVLPASASRPASAPTTHP